jgi:hypothetical protein
MNQPTVYRVQDNEGRGPWRPGFSRVWVENRADHMLLVPCFRQFNMNHLRKDRHVGCGCRTMEQLRRWFTVSEYERLRGLGYQAVLMAVNKIVFESDIQCVFERKKALAVDFEPIELYEPT